MSKKIASLVFVFAFLVSLDLPAQNTWPREIKLKKDTVITLYQPQPETLNGNALVSRTVVSVRKGKKAEPVFGVIWTEATINTDLNSRTASLEKLKITDVKAPEGTAPEAIERFKSVVEAEVPKWNLIMSVDDIVATLEENRSVNSDNFSTKAPDILYADKLTTLVLIDGEPVIKRDESIKMEKVFNTPFLIVRDPSDSRFYLYAGQIWYGAPSLDKGWEVATELPKAVSDLKKSILIKEVETKEKASKGKKSKDQPVVEEPVVAPPTAILVRTKPSELIQSDGEPKFASIEGTGLLYVANSPDNIFKVVEDQQFYIVITGRWYKSPSLSGPWNYVASDKLPPDFAKIPEGSEKDIVLANVAGTNAAREAVQEAKIPQTAKIDRKETKCTVTFDGEPKFEKIEGTGIEMALNSSITVLHSESNYYAVDNGVWFMADNVKGPWQVSEKRPKNVDKIPPESPAYNTKYVYIYDSTPEYVYMGYTPGYMGCYVYGPTVIYGTGFYYNPWIGSVYYPYPVTYGYGMCYNPYMGWNMAVGFSVGFFAVGFYGGCYWGPPMYPPPYYHYPPHGGYPGYGHGGGYYGRPPGSVNAGNRPSTMPAANRNIYNQRNGVSTRDVARTPSSANRVSDNRAGSNPTGNRTSARDLNSPSSGSRASNNLYSDKAGNVYRNDRQGNWEQRGSNSWQQDRSAGTRDLERSQQMRDNGYNRQTNYNSMNRPSMGNMNRGGGFGGGGRRR